MFGKSRLGIWIPEVCLQFIVRLESFCDEISKYPLVIIAKTGNRCKNLRFLPFVALRLQCIDFVNASTFCQWLGHVSHFIQITG